MRYLKKYDKLILENEEVQEQEVTTQEEDQDGDGSNPEVTKKVFGEFLSKMETVIEQANKLPSECPENPAVTKEQCATTESLCGELVKMYEVMKWSIETDSVNLDHIGEVHHTILRQYAENANYVGFQDYAVPAIRAIQEWNKAIGEDIND